jgi:hypothetical protein
VRSLTARCKVQADGSTVRSACWVELLPGPVRSTLRGVELRLVATRCVAADCWLAAPCQSVAWCRGHEASYDVTPFGIVTITPFVVELLLTSWPDQYPL